jgi:drug/metabolite transporter (DMT)-like permease
MENIVKENKQKALFHILICVCLWALIPVVSKTGQAGLDNHQFLFWSGLVSVITLFVATIINKKLSAFKTYSKKDMAYAVFTGFIGAYLCYILLYFGYASASGLEVLILQYSWPLMVVLISIFYLKEKQNLRRWLSVIIGLTGVFIVLTKGNLHNINFGNLKVDLLVIAGAFCIALFSILSKKLTSEPYSLNTIYFITGCVCAFLSMLLFSKFALPSRQNIIPILINGIFVNGISYILWVKGLRLANASYLAPFGFLTPVISAIYLITFFNEPLLMPYIAGLVLVLISGLINK